MVENLTCAPGKPTKKNTPRPSNYGTLVAAACLAHDVGNPPFGHSGEDAIRQWFRKSKVADQPRSRMTPDQRAELESYEGNAQGFRVLTSPRN